MKKFTKLFLSCALVSALALSTTAAVFAEGEDDTPATTAETYAITFDASGVTGTYDAGKNEITVDGITPAAETQATYLVIKGADKTNIAQEDVQGIDQKAGVDFDNTGLIGNPKFADLEEGARQLYTVYIGYYESASSFKKVTGTFTIKDPTAVSTIQLIIGNTDEDPEVDGYDQTSMLRYVAELTTDIGDIGTEYEVDDANYSGLTKYVVGDCDTPLDGEVDGYDQTCMLRYVAELTTDIGDIGKTISVVEK